MWREENPFALLVAMYTGAATVENSMDLPPKYKNGTAYDFFQDFYGFESYI